LAEVLNRGPGVGDAQPRIEIPILAAILAKPERMRRVMRLLLAGIAEPGGEALAGIIEARHAAFVGRLQPILASIGGEQPLAAFRVGSGEQPFDPDQSFFRELQHGRYAAVAIGEVTIVDSDGGIETAATR
jgi:hypothetical protein